jgi:hypothetical protein
VWTKVRRLWSVSDAISQLTAGWLINVTLEDFGSSQTKKQPYSDAKKSAQNQNVSYHSEHFLSLLELHRNIESSSGVEYSVEALGK